MSEIFCALKHFQMTSHLVVHELVQYHFVRPLRNQALRIWFGLTLEILENIITLPGVKLVFVCSVFRVIVRCITHGPNDEPVDFLACISGW